MTNDKANRPAHDRPAPKTSTRQDSAKSSGTGRHVWSRQVSWWTVHEFVAPWIQAARPFPMLGTPSWDALDDHDPIRWAALLSGAEHWALRVETCQEAEYQASKDVSVAADWAAIAERIHKREMFYAANPWLRRRPS